MARALVGLGSNLGDRQQSLEAAVAALSALAQTRLLATSRWHETLPVGGPAGQSPFLNGAVTLETSLAPLALLSALQDIEQSLKRERHETWAARTLDLDLLLYDELVLESRNLTIPHPRMAFRRFVLAPASEVATDWRHPTTGWTIAQLLHHLDTASPYVAIGGIFGEANQRLAAGIAAALSGKLVRGPAACFEWLPTPDPTGRNLQPAIELMDRQAELLASMPSEGLVVSDFWFGQKLAEAHLAFGQEAYGIFESHWHKHNGRLVQPKLIVWLRDAGDVGSGENAGQQRQWEQQLDECLNRPGWGPMLKVSPRVAVPPLEDAIAAIQAMA